jgi:DNA ligase D-like protein (predicted 3'-phosphoesterase)
LCEVVGLGKKKGAGKGGRSFVVQEHHATRLHWDFRLEVGSVLRSWAVPKGPPLAGGVKRLAVETEDHALEYGGFEGEIPEGHYGAGEVLIWDRGSYEPEEMEKDKLVFRLKGRKMKGRYCLVRLKRGGGKSWILFKTMPKK